MFTFLIANLCCTPMVCMQRAPRWQVSSVSMSSWLKRFRAFLETWSMHFWRTCSIEQSAMNFPWLLASLLFKGQPVWLFPRKLTTGWWFGTMEFYDFPFSWECHHPNCYSLHDFSEGSGRYTTNQIFINHRITIINHILTIFLLTIYYNHQGYISCAAPRTRRLPLVHEPKAVARCQAWPGMCGLGESWLNVTGEMWLNRYRYSHWR